jgi:acyl transferase domain-containing protein
MTTEVETDQLEGVAVIGMAGRFPGASSLEQFWQNLRDGIESITTFTNAELLRAGENPALLFSPGYVKASATLEGIDLFDADFFGFTPREAEVTDPQHRIFLECAWEALENAGYDADRYGGRIGVFAGAGLHCYYQHNLASHPALMERLGELPEFIAVEKDFLSTRVSYRLNLKGPSISLQTACSTSLVAVHLGCQSVLTGDSDIVLAGGVSLKVPQTAGYLHQEGSILSPDGHCRAFDASAQGTVFGSGAGIVVLKRLADAVEDKDNIRAVIRGSAINNDGARKVGYTAPSIDGQATVVAEAHAVAGVRADQVSYIETHGTGTKLGDPIEMAALTQAFRRTSQKKEFCAIGSLKTNVGHLDAAAGVAGLIKVILALENRKLPPSLNFEHPNPAIDFASSPFYVQQELSAWEPASGRRVAGVSSFGIGGTNAHVIVEEAPPRSLSDAALDWQLLPVSARSPKALEESTNHLAQFLKSHGDLKLADVAFTLQQGRKAFPYRRVMAARDIGSAINLLQTRDAKRVHDGKIFDGDSSVVYMFPAQGAQHVNMGRDLYENEPIFRQYFDRCAAFLHPLLGCDLRNVVYPDAGNIGWASEHLRQTRFTQPSVFSVDYSLAQLWMAYEITPAAMIGHSLGEYVAATLAGVFDLEDALTLVAERARLMQELPSGSMLVVHLSEEKLKPWLRDGISLAAINAPELSVISGPAGEIGHVTEEFRCANVEVQPLITSHAFHSAMIEPMIAPFVETVKRTKRRAPHIPFVSTLTGTWIKADEAIDPDYWGRQTRYGVRFSPAILELISTPGRVLLEVGPGNSLCTLAGLHLKRDSQCIAVNSLRHAKEDRSDQESTLTALGRLWTAGVNVDWAKFSSAGLCNRVVLPTYPFERRRYWIDALRRATDTQAISEQATTTTPSNGVPVARTLEPGHCTSSDNAESIGAEAFLHARPSLTSEYVAPSTQTERVLARLWQEVLGLKRVGVDDNFFELGGQSLIAVTLASEISQAFDRRVSLASLLAAPTIHQFAHFMASGLPSDERNESSGNGTAISQSVRRFLLESGFLPRGSDVADNSSLLRQGIIDEMNVLDLVQFLEETFSLALSDDDVNSDNLDSIDNITAYVQRKSRRPVATTNLALEGSSPAARV